MKFKHKKEIKPEQKILGWVSLSSGTLYLDTYEGIKYISSKGLWSSRLRSSRLNASEDYRKIYEGDTLEVTF